MHHAGISSKLTPHMTVAPRPTCWPAILLLPLSPPPLWAPRQVSPDQCIMLASAVSSTALGAMAAAEGFRFEQTLTGFKWLGNIAQQRRAQGLRVLFAFEEALGFMFPDIGLVRKSEREV